MTAFEPTPAVRAAAHRAAVLADIARRRAPFALALGGRALLDIADLLDIAAISFETEQPMLTDGIPTDAWFAIEDAERTAADNRATGFPSGFGQYITQPFTRCALTAPAPLGLASPGLADREARLAAALATVHGHLDTTATEEVACALLEAAFALHSKLTSLAQLAR